MEKEEECNIGLSLGVGCHEDYKTFKKYPHMLFPTKPRENEKVKTAKRSKNTDKEEEEESMVRDKYDNTRKKLMLSKGQSTLLEESFRENHTLNLMQKKVLADRLNLRPQQVEVWFQNRRARNKLKQTEVDCEMLCKWCESLSDENRRLRKELQELRSRRSMGDSSIDC